MANRILVATLFPGSGNVPNLMTVSPETIHFNTGDTVYLVVNGVGVAGGQPITGNLTFSSASPFGSGVTVNIPSGAKTGTPMLLGQITAPAIQATYSYVVNISCNGQTYIEDPDMQINS